MSVQHKEDGYPVNTSAYEWKSASVTVAGTSPTTDLTSITGFTTLFDTVPRAHQITIESSGAAYVRLNAVTNDVITIGSTTPYEDNFAIVDKIFVATNGGAVTLTVKLR
jgi:hypothetical protein